MRNRFTYIIKLTIIAILSQLSSAVYANGIDKPFIHNFSALEYGAHNRNFDIECDNTGKVYVANFEGLLMYDGFEWHKLHTPHISRVTALLKTHNGTIWFGGYNFIGYIIKGDSLSAKYIVNDNNRSSTFGEISNICENNGKIFFKTISGSSYSIQGGKVRTISSYPANARNHNEIKLRLFDATLTTTTNNGISVFNFNRTHHLFNFNKTDGLCSNTINAITYDGKGNVWGATDNGVFVATLSDVYSSYTEHDGLEGQVTCIYQNRQHLYVGTLQGLFVLNNEGKFTKVKGIDQACWQIIGGKSYNEIIIASADGVFSYSGTAQPKQLSTNHTLSIAYASDGSLIMGQVRGIYRLSSSGKEISVSNANNTVKLQKEKNGGIWAYTLYGESLYLAPESAQFVKKDNPSLTLMLSFTDSKNIVWQNKKNGLGLVGKGLPAIFDKWLNPFNEAPVQTMFIYETTAWLGGTFGLIKMDLKRCWKSKPFTSKLYIRSLTIDNRDVRITVANDRFNGIGTTKYSYRLHDYENWSRWSNNNDINFFNLRYGSYNITVRSKDIYGNIVESAPRSFNIPYPFYLRWYAILLYLFIIGSALYGFYRWRIRRMKREKEQLEKLVNERTQELKEAHKQLLRKEKEATVGKLTKGLIDRILNPMNYINNFSHMSVGLAGDLKEDIEDDKDKMTPDIYEDVEDVIDMLKTNLEKIEQHGLSTTRILKAMEEMLKERSTNLQTTNLTDLCQLNIEMLGKYYADDISKLNIKIEWNKPADNIMADIVSDGMSKTIMSLLGNSIYALKKKAEKNSFEPMIRLQLTSTEDNVEIKLYDNGIGIEDTIIQNIFDPFFTTKPTGDAPGVGLYLSQQIIQDFGGTISVESKKDIYTEFTITLPVVKQTL